MRARNDKARSPGQHRDHGPQQNGSRCGGNLPGARRQQKQTPTTGDGHPLAQTILADGGVSVKLGHLLDDLADGAVALQSRARATRRANDVRNALDALKLVYGIWLLYERLARAEVGMGEGGRP